MSELIYSHPFSILIASFIAGVCVTKITEKRKQLFLRNKFYAKLPTYVYSSLPEKCHGITREELLNHYIQNTPGIPIGIIANELNKFDWLKGDKFDGELFISHNDNFGPYTDTEFYWIKSKN
ncbi:hypothetical protein [Vibrio cholerae]|uniref:hypothetical protein n=1 Tax=Vibrio cholerae TaxID=666 RepID=UPI000C70C21A|nr:hypothetical protein [Vibrio cholerae]TLE15645.1 hypothetical protein D2923_17920 [Vibrio cholerae]TLE16395.1 hypothetical protein D2924_18920 [Vibrio cholerae]TLE26665.1 hypothetical protein D2925_18675 [Vibrio cholerae]TQP44450.1 hypothetical protein FLL90_16615 [Vibrio cholerae]TQP82982.1 hypothetical protein FLL89_10770 [Vibrio cholerae]